MPERRYLTADELRILVERARRDDEQAWNRLVDELGLVVWKAVNMMTQDADIRDDAYAATWLRLAEHLDTIQQPEKLPGWLATTAVNEARRLLRQRYREVERFDEPIEDAAGAEAIGDDGDFARGLIESENRSAVRRAFAKMDVMSREVLTVLVVADPPPSYAEAAELLGRPIGSLGPLRRRALRRLETLLNEGKAE